MPFHGSTSRLVLVLFAIVSLGCGSDDSGSPAGPATPPPSDDLTPVLGAWSADSIVVSPKANPAVSREIVGEDGAEFTFIVQNSGSYSASLRAFGALGHEVGTIRLNGELMLFTVTSPQPGSSSGRWQREGDRLILESDLLLDFNQDGTPDDLTTRFVLSP